MHNILSVPLRIFFVATYYIGLTPFKIVLNRDNEFVVQKWFPQKLICGILTVLSVTPHITHLEWFTTQKKSDWSPPLYFRFFTLISRLFWYFIAHKNVWFHSQKFIGVVKFVAESKSLPKIYARRSLVKVFSILCVVTCGLSGLLETSGMLNDFDIKRPNQIIDFSEANFASLIFQITLFTYGCVAGFYWQLLQFVCILTLWIPSKEFAKSLKEENIVSSRGMKWDGESKLLSISDHPHWKRMREKYFSLKELSELINNAIGGMMLSFTAFALCTYSYLLDSVFLTTMETDRWRLIVRYVSVTLTYSLAADVCRQVGHLRDWINSDSLGAASKYPFVLRVSKLRNHRMNILFHEVDKQHAVGIRGGRAFTITYGFVANVCLTIMTYFVICVQFRFEAEKRLVTSSIS